MGRVDLFTSAQHFADHALPVWNALPARVRGEHYWHADDVPANRGFILTASGGDYHAAHERGRRIIMMEHGAGLTIRHLDGRILGHNSYGGARRPGVELLLVPGPNAARAYRDGHATAPIVEIGLPKIHAWRKHKPPRNINGKPVLAFAFHWECHVAPETMGSWRTYLAKENARIFEQLAQDFHLVGHGHPADIHKMRHLYAYHGIPVIEHFNDVIKTAHVLAVDTSSVLWEFAALNRPVIVLNHDRYRREAVHGLRFWEGADVGPNVNHVRELPEKATEALWWNENKRATAVALAYSNLDTGLNVAREAILEVTRDS